MALSVAQLLELTALDPAEPRLLCGDEERDVRWVHTSEIFDIAPLLKGGEALLTSGLGLVGAPAARVRQYARSLVETDIAALLFEVGRTFSDIPVELVDEFRRNDIALVRLHGVVPFVEITEAAHRRILDAESRSLRAADDASTRLLDVLLTGGGTAAVLSVVHELTGAPAAYVDTDEREIASSGFVPHGATELDRPVLLFGEVRGFIRSAAAVTAEHRVIVDRGASALALELARSGPAMPTRRFAHEEFLGAIERRRHDPGELVSRSHALGFTLRRGEWLVAICVTPGPGQSLDGLYRQLADTVPKAMGASIIGALGAELVVLASVNSDEKASLRSLVDRALGGTATLYRSATVSNPVAGWDELPAALDDARTAIEIAPLIASGPRPLLADDTALVRLLRSSRSGVLEDFVDHQLSPILTHDAQRGSQLLTTLSEYFRNGQDKSATAHALGIRRQTLYARLERIDSLLGPGATSDSSRAVTLHVATVGWSILTRTVPRPIGERAARTV